MHIYWELLGVGESNLAACGSGISSQGLEQSKRNEIEGCHVCEELLC